MPSEFSRYLRRARVFPQLARLIATNLYVTTWLFKIDDEFNGRGHAYLNVDHIKSL
jgi:hypothetical protein